MIVQACLNGARRADFHPALPLTIEAMAQDAAHCVAAGAAELHVHPRDPDGRESLHAAVIGTTFQALRKACPGTLIGVSSGIWIEGDNARTLAAIEEWDVLPDYASVNLAEPGADAVIGLLRSKGVGVEAGLASVADAELLARLGLGRSCLRFLLELEQQDFAEAMAEAEEIAGVLWAAGLRRPILLHGFNATMWDFVTLAARHRWSTRVGLEDGRLLPDGTMAENNAALVVAAVRVFWPPD